MAGQVLSWQPNSFYRLRDRTLAGHVVEAGTDGLRGYVIRLSGLKSVNGEFRYAPEDVRRPAEWGLDGNCRGESSYDLMELIRP